MDWFTLLEVGIKILEGVLSKATDAKLPAEIIAAVEAALNSLRSVYGTPVTKDQLESLRG